MHDRTPRTWRARGRLAPLLFGHALALAISGAPAPARAEPAAVTVSVGGGLDAEAVRGRLAAELSSRIVARPDGSTRMSSSP